MNFTHAAAELHISQPALHVKVRKLAEGIGTALYVREGRTLALTDTGRSVAGFARHIDAETAEFLNAVRGAPPPPLVLAAGEGAHLYVLAGAVRRLLGRGERIRLVSSDHDHTIDAVRNRQANLGVTVISSAPPGLEMVPIASYPQVAVLPPTHPLASRRTLLLEDLSGAELIVAAPRRPQRQALEEALRRKHIPWSVAVEADGWAQMLHFASLEVGICVVNGCVTPGADLVGRPIEDLPPVSYAALHRPGDRRDPRLAAVLDAIKAGAP